MREYSFVATRQLVVSVYLFETLNPFNLIDPPSPVLGDSGYLLANDNCTSNPLVSPLSALTWL